jgi:hypothetical protein
METVAPPSPPGRIAKAYPGSARVGRAGLGLLVPVGAPLVRWQPNMVYNKDGELVYLC